MTKNAINQILQKQGYNKTFHFLQSSDGVFLNTRNI